MKYLFPYEKVKRGSTVIIYGFGDVGREFLMQIQQTNYCNILCFLDINNYSLDSDIVPVYNPDNIANISEDEYDYIVVGLESNVVAGKVISAVLDSNVDEKKIIWKNYVLDDTIYAPKNIFSCIMDNPDYIHDVIKMFMVMGNRNRRFFTPLINEIKACKESEKIEKLISSIENTDLSLIEKIIFYNILYDADALDKNRMRILMKLLLSLNKKDRDTIFVQGYSYIYIPDIYRNYLYDEYYTDWRKLHIKICDDYELKCNKTAVPKYNVKKIAVVLISFSGDTTGYQGVALSVINYLSKKGYYISVFITDLLNNECSGSFLSPSFSYKNSYMYREKIKNVLENNVKVFFRNEENIKGRLQGLIDDIESYDPDIIMDMSDEAFPQAAIIKRCYPIWCWPMRGFATGAFFTKCTTPNLYRSIEYNKIFNSVNVQDLIEIYICVMPYINNSICYRREQLGFGNSDFIIVTVGTRLHREVTADLVYEMSILLRKHKNARWLLIGTCPDIDTKIYGDIINNRQIIFWGYENNLAALYKISNLFLQPRRMGGGVSVRTAMYMGLPIAMLNEISDALNVVDKKNTVNGDYSDLIKYIERNIIDEKFYYKNKTESKERIEKKIQNNFYKFKMIFDICLSEYNKTIQGVK